MFHATLHDMSVRKAIVCTGLWLCVVLTMLPRLSLQDNMAVSASRNNFKLSVIFTSDMMGEVSGNNETVDGVSTTLGGYARLATAMKQAEASVPSGAAVLRFHQINTIATNLFSQTFRGLAEKEVLQYMNVQAVGLSSSEMFTNLRTLATNLYENASFNLLCGNCLVPAYHPLSAVLHPFRVFSFPYINAETNASSVFRVGVTAFVSEDQCERVTTCYENGICSLKIRPLVSELHSIVENMQFVQQVNFTIILTAGIAVDAHGNEIQYLTLLNGPVLLLSGQHSVDMTNVTSVQSTVSSSYNLLYGLTRGGGREVGTVNMQFTDSALFSYNASQLVVKACNDDASPTPGCIPADSAVKSAVEVFNQQVEAFKNTTVGYLPRPLSMSLCWKGECEIGNLLADAALWKMGQLACNYSVFNQGSIRASLPQGNITIGNIKEVFPFGNKIVSFTLKGKWLLDSLNRGVARVQLGAGRMPQVGNMQLEVDMARTWYPLDAFGYGMRVSSLRMRNPTSGIYEDVQLEQEYRICTNDFLRQGLDDYTTFALYGTNAIDEGPQKDEVLADYLRNNVVDPKLEGRIKNITSDVVSVGTCEYPPLLITSKEGSLSDYCKNGRRATTNVTLSVQPTGLVTRSISLDFNRSFALLNDGRDYVTIYSGTSIQPSPITFTYNNTIIQANWTKSLPVYTLTLFGSALAVNYVSFAERDGTGLSINYTSSEHCPAGYIVRDMTCAICPPGTFSNGIVSQCALCPQGTYSAVSGSNSCSVCPENQYTDSEGMPVCRICDHRIGYILKSAFECECAPGTVASTIGCVLLESSNFISTIVSSIVAVTLVVTGYILYRRRMAAVRTKALASRRMQSKTLRVTSRRARIISDLVKFSALVLVELTGIFFDWKSLLKYNDPKIRTIFTAVVIFGNVVSISSVITRIHFERQRWLIRTKGIEVSSKKRGSVGVSNKPGLDGPQADLGKDRAFIDATRKMLLARQELRLTQIVALPGVIKALPVLAVESMLIVRDKVLYDSLLISYSLTVSGLAFNLGVCVVCALLSSTLDNRVHVLTEYRIAKLEVDRMLNAAGMARISAGYGNQSNDPGKSRTSASTAHSPAQNRSTSVGSSEKVHEPIPVGASALGDFISTTLGDISAMSKPGSECNVHQERSNESNMLATQLRGTSQGALVGLTQSTLHGPITDSPRSASQIITTDDGVSTPRELDGSSCFQSQRSVKFATLPPLDFERQL